MRSSRPLLISTMLVLAALTSVHAWAQAPVVITRCTGRDVPPLPNRNTCIVAQGHFYVGERITISAYREEKINNSWSTVNDTFGIYSLDAQNNETLIASGNTDPNTRRFVTSKVFDKKITIGLRARRYPGPGGDASPVLVEAILGYFPSLSMTLTPSPAHFDEAIRIDVTGLAYRPTGKLSLYFRGPGASSPALVAQHPITVPLPANLEEHTTLSQRFDVAIVSPGVPGEYMFSVKILEDPLNYDEPSNDYRVRLGPHPTTTSLAQSVSQSVQGKPVTLTATVLPAAGTIAAPIGSVEFYDGTVLLGSAPLSGNAAVLTNTINLRAVGSRSLTARYVGDSWNVASTSPAITHTTKVDPAILVPIIMEVLE